MGGNIFYAEVVLFEQGLEVGALHAGLLGGLTDIIVVST